MPYSVRLNDCCRREKTFPTMTYFKFDGAPGEHPGHPRGSHPPLAQPPLGMLFDRSLPRVHGWRPRWSKDAHRPEGVPLSVGHGIFLSSHTVHYNPVQVPRRVTRSDRPEMVH